MAKPLAKKNSDGEIIGWQAQVRVKGFPSQSKTFDRYADAVDWADPTRVAMKSGTFLINTQEAKSTTLGDAVQTFIAEQCPKHRGGANTAYQLGRFLRDEANLCKFALTNLKTVQFEDYRDRRLAIIKPSSVIKELGLLSSVIKQAMKTCKLAENPLSDVKRPKASGRDVVLDRAKSEHEDDFGYDEAGVLINALKQTRNPWVLPAFLLAMETAMRQGEIVKFKWAHVHLKKRVISLPREITKTDDGRDVPLSSLAIAVLEVLHEHNEVFKKPIDGRVFNTTSSALKQAFGHARDRAGLNHVHFHDLRHTSATRTAEAHDLITTKVVTGHKDYRSLMRYINIKPSDVAKKLG